MHLTDGFAPVRHFVWDGFVSPRPDWTVAPASDAGAWEVQYSNDMERGKRTSRAVAGGWADFVLDRMHGAEVRTLCARTFGVPAVPDVTLWGGGLQVIEPGGRLGTHLDGARHPHRRHLRKAVQMVCFAHGEWEPEWGGQFYFADPLGNVVLRFDPVPGRLICFEQTDLAYHGVAPVTGPAERISVASALLADARPEDTRLRAMFLPSR